ncbi:MAG: YdbH domain-containing protein, partial [Woeseiaceae bacterium]
AASGSDINVVSRALGNFQFDSLTSDVSYTETGDLKLKMRLSGINPDMDPLQPVILNLGVENNIPQLLRSLQATRAIEDVLQREGIN